MTSPKGVATLALDYGKKRIGLAISPTNTGCLPLATLQNIDKYQVKEALSKICRGYGVGQLVIGLPITPKEKIGQLAKEAQKVGQYLSKSLNLPVAFQDETLTTRAAEQKQKRLRERGLKKTTTTDSIAAQLILQDYLEGIK